MKNVAKAVFLDRDGTLIKTRVSEGRPYAINKLEDIEIELGVPEGCSELIKNGFKLIMVTNQPDVASELCREDDVTEINRYLEQVLGIVKSFVCYHSRQQNCFCRKPKPGMIFRAADEFALELSSCALIGDRAPDIQSAQVAGLSSALWIDKGYREPTPEGSYVKVLNFEEACFELLKSQKNHYYS